MVNNPDNPLDSELYKKELEFVKGLNMSDEDSHRMAISLFEMKQMLKDKTLWQFDQYTITNSNNSETS